jgi:hypothetical protein
MVNLISVNSYPLLKWILADTCVSRIGFRADSFPSLRRLRLQSRRSLGHQEYDQSHHRMLVEAASRSPRRAMVLDLEGRLRSRTGHDS